MAIDFGGLATTDNYSTAYTPKINEAVKALAYMLDPAYASYTGTPFTNAKRFNGGALEKFNGSSWVAQTLAGGYNGTVGATTPSTGAFTTLSASGSISNTGGSIAISGGTNPYLSLNDGTGIGYVQVYFGNIDITPRAGKYITLSAPTYVTGALSATGALTTAGLQEVSGNLGLGVVPSAWGAPYYTALEIGANGASLSAWTPSLSSSKTLYLTSNGYQVYSGGPAWRYTATGESALYEQFNGVHKWHTASSGTAGTAITFTQAMTLDVSGNLGVGITPTYKLDVAGAGRVAGAMRVEGSTNPYLLLSNTVDVYYIQVTSGILDLYTPGSAGTIRSSGKHVFTQRAHTSANALASFSATPTFDAALSNFHTMPAMTANVTAITLSNAQEGQFLTIRFTQDGTGGRTITTGNMGATNAPSIQGAPTTTANKASYLNLTYNAAAARWEGSWLGTT